MYTKAITAFITAALGMLLTLGVDFGVEPAFIGSVAVVINAAFVYFLPNK